MFENDYTINGKHATYLKFLAKKNARDDQSPDNPTAARLFERYIDVYMNAAVFGLLYNRGSINSMLLCMNMATITWSMMSPLRFRIPILAPI